MAFQKPRQRSNSATRIRTGMARKPSYLEEHAIKHIDYKDVKLLQRFIGSNGRILPRRLTRLDRQEQRLMTMAIKRARHIALLPFVQEAEVF